MRTGVILTFPQYTGVFLNRESKHLLLNSSDDNIFKPLYRKRFGRHITLHFNPGTTLNIKWGAKVELKIIRHIRDSYCQLIEVQPISVIYNENGDSITITNKSDVFDKLGISDMDRRFYITISAEHEDADGNKITYKYSENLLNGDFTDVDCTDHTDNNHVLYGFCGMYGDAIVENTFKSRKYKRHPRPQV